MLAAIAHSAVGHYLGWLRARLGGTYRVRAEDGRELEIENGHLVLGQIGNAR